MKNPISYFFYFTFVFVNLMFLSSCTSKKVKIGETFNGDGNYTVISTDKYATYPKSLPLGVTSFQGFGYYNGVIFQFYAENAVELIDYKTGKVISDLKTETKHGNSIAFLNEFYSKDDEFPMAIVADGLSNRAFKVRLQRNCATTIQEYVFPKEKCGNYVSTMVDASKNILYTVGYTEKRYYDNSSGHNDMIFCKWNLKKITENEDGTYTPRFIESFNTPFILTLQAPCFYNNRLYIVSSHWENPDTKVYVVDPKKKAITNILEDFPKGIKSVETEGIFFAEIDDEYVAIMKPNSGLPYHLMKFES